MSDSRLTRNWPHSLVNEETNQEAPPQTSDDRNWERRGWKAQADASDEDHSLETLAEYSDEREDEHCVFLAKMLESIPCCPTFGAVCCFEGLGQFDTPLGLKLGDTKKSSTHNTDNDRCKKCKSSLPDGFSACPVVLAKPVEGCNYASANAETQEDPKKSPKPNL